MSERYDPAGRRAAKAGEAWVGVSGIVTPGPGGAQRGVEARNGITWHLQLQPLWKLQGVPSGDSFAQQYVLLLGWWTVRWRYERPAFRFTLLTEVKR
jgi:hypothetical protein